MKLCVKTTNANLALVSEVGPNRFTWWPAGILIPPNATRFESVAYKYVSSFVMY
jgi:hypothetical protein